MNSRKTSASLERIKKLLACACRMEELSTDLYYSIGQHMEGYSDLECFGEDTLDKIGDVLTQSKYYLKLIIGEKGVE